MSAITIGLAAATLAALVAYRIRHGFLPPARRSRAEGPAPAGKPIAVFAPREEAAKPGKETVIVSPSRDLEDILVVVVTMLFSVTAIYILLSGQYGEGDRTLAAGVIGVVTGFWFKSAWRR
jgi:hypothetical protein